MFNVKSCCWRLGGNFLSHKTPETLDETGKFDSFVLRKGWLPNNGKPFKFCLGMSSFQYNSHMISAIVGFTSSALSLDESSMFVASPCQINFRASCFLNLQANIHVIFLVFCAQSSAANSPQAGGNTQGVHCSVVYGEAQWCWPPTHLANTTGIYCGKAPAISCLGLLTRCLLVHWSN